MQVAMSSSGFRACSRIGKDGSLPTVMLGGDGRHTVLFSGKVPVDGASAQARLGDVVIGGGCRASPGRIEAPRRVRYPLVPHQLEAPVGQVGGQLGRDEPEGERLTDTAHGPHRRLGAGEDRGPVEHASVHVGEQDR